MGIRAFRLDCAQFHLNGLWISGGARRTSSHVRVLSEWDATDDDAQLCLRAVDTNHIVRRRPLCSFRPERHFARRLVPRHRVPMLSPISDPPRLRVTLMDGSTREVGASLYDALA